MPVDEVLKHLPRHGGIVRPQRVHPQRLLEQQRLLGGRMVRIVIDHALIRSAGGGPVDRLVDAKHGFHPRQRQHAPGGQIGIGRVVDGLIGQLIRPRWIAIRPAQIQRRRQAIQRLTMLSTARSRIAQCFLELARRLSILGRSVVVPPRAQMRWRIALTAGVIAPDEPEQQHRDEGDSNASHEVMRDQSGGEANGDAPRETWHVQDQRAVGCRHALAPRDDLALARVPPFH